MSIGELEGVQEMYHDLGETSHLVRGLVFGIRPSIAWRFGIPLPPLDNLTADGQLGWQIGLKIITRRQQRQPDNTPESVISWLKDEGAQSQRHQISTLKVIESLRWCLPSLNDEILAMDPHEFVQCWTKNLNESASPGRSRTDNLKVRSLAGDTIGQLSKYPGTESLHVALSRFGHPDDVIAGESWQRFASPRLHPPVRHRQDWLDVLAETHVATGPRTAADSLPGHL